MTLPRILTKLLSPFHSRLIANSRSVKPESSVLSQPTPNQNVSDGLIVDCSNPRRSISHPLQSPSRDTHTSPTTKSSTSSISGTILSAVDASKMMAVCKEDLYNVIFNGREVNDIFPKLDLLVENPCTHFEALILRALAFRAAGKMIKFVADCDTILAIDPNCRFAILHKAAVLSAPNIFFDYKDEKNAANLAKEWADSHPADRFAAMVSSMFPVYHVDYRVATERLQKILDNNSQDIHVLTLLMAVCNKYDMIWRDAEYRSKAVKCAHSILKIDNKHQFALAMVAVSSGNNPHQQLRPSTSIFPTLVSKLPLPDQDECLELLFKK